MLLLLVTYPLNGQLYLHNSCCYKSWDVIFVQQYVDFVLTGLGDVLIQISETQRRLTAEMEGLVSTLLSQFYLTVTLNNPSIYGVYSTFVILLSIPPPPHHICCVVLVTTYSPTFWSVCTVILSNRTSCLRFLLLSILIKMNCSSLNGSRSRCCKQWRKMSSWMWSTLKWVDAFSLRIHAIKWMK